MKWDLTGSFIVDDSVSIPIDNVKPIDDIENTTIDVSRDMMLEVERLAEESGLRDYTKRGTELDVSSELQLLIDSKHDRNIPFRYNDVTHPDYGAHANNVDNDRDHINTAQTILGTTSAIYFSVGTYKISSDITISSGSIFAQGAVLSVDSGVTVTITGHIQAGLSQIFTGAGTVSFAGNKSISKVYSQWWGAVGNDSTDDTSAIQKAITAAGTMNPVGSVHIIGNIYKITSVLQIVNKNIRIIGDGDNISILKVYGTGGGLYIEDTGGASHDEGVVIEHLRIQKADNTGTGYGIQIYGGRRTKIRHCWVGGFYSEDTKGFAHGIYVSTNPAYDVEISHCHLQRNTKGITLMAGANNARLHNNVIWYGEYSVYIEGASGVRVNPNNGCENYTIAALYVKDCYNVLAVGNYFESLGVQSVILEGSNANVQVYGNTNAVQVYAQHEITDNSNSTLTNRHEDYQIPIKTNTEITREQAGGLISLNRTNIGGDVIGYAGDQLPNNIKMRAISGDWEFTNDLPNRCVDIQTQLNAKNISTPFAGTGTQYGNLLSYSEDFNSWSKNTVTVISNKAIAPDGTQTADYISDSEVGGAVSLGASVVAGEAMTFSVWLKSDFEQNAILYNYSTDNGLVGWSRAIRLTKYWKRYSLTDILVGVAATIGVGIQITSSGSITKGLYAWGAQVNKYTAVEATDDSGINDKAYLYDSGSDFLLLGIDIGGHLQVESGNYSAHAVITEINTALPFTAGTTAAPAVGVTVTGGTSGAKGVVVGTVITSGTFATNDAVGWIEIEQVKGTFQAENVTWTGGSCTGAIDKKNCIVRCETLIGNSGGSSPTDIDNGATVFLAPSYVYTPSAYCKTTGTAIAQTAVTFATETLGVKSIVGTTIDIGGTTLLGSRVITVDTGGVFNIDIGSASGDDFTVDTNKLVIEGDTGNVAIGTATPDANSKFSVVGSSNSLTTLTASKEFTILFPTGVANQKVDIYLVGTQQFWGSIDVEVVGSYSGENSAGLLKKNFGLGLNAGGTIYANESRYVEESGVIANNFAISDISWDAGNSRYKLMIVHRVSTVNQVVIRLTAFGYSSAQISQFLTFTIGSIYTTDTTVYARPEIYYNGNLGIATTTGLARLAINGGLAVGEDADPGDNNLKVVGNVEIDGNFNHDGSNVGFYGTAPAVQQTGIAALKVNYTTLDLDTEAEIISAINTTNTAINALRTALNTLGLTTTV